MSIALADLSDWDSLLPAPAGTSPDRTAVEVRTIFRGVPIAACLLSRAPSRPGGRRPSSSRSWSRSAFTIGSDAGVDAAVAADFVPWSSHPLVMAAGDGFVVNVTPRMRGKVRVRGRVQALGAFVRENGSTFPLPASGAAQLDCGATTFIVGHTNVANPLPAKPWRWSWTRDTSPAVAAVAFALVALLVLFLPPDPRAISLDLLERDPHLVATVIKPPVVEPAPAPDPASVAAVAPASAAKPAGPASGRPATAPASTRAAPTAGGRATRAAAAGSVSPRADPQLASARAVDAILGAGVLGVLKAATGSQVAAIFRGDGAFGPDAANVLSNLASAPLAGPFGGNGLDVKGTGSHAAGTWDTLIGTGDRIETAPLRSNDGRGQVDHVAPLRPRRVTALPWLPEEAHVRGALDKEIVRRVIRLHLNEIKYCYEQELVRVPSLAGRLVVQFTIAPAGQVIAAFVQSSTLANARVESCAVQAVRRWPFPKPDGGGLVTVSYPFVLAAAGGG